MTEQMEITPREMEWISVKDRLPNEDEEVMMYHKQHRDIGYYDFVSSTFFYASDDKRCSHVTHWMPLPEPPKK